jgi:hypothetical protein
MIESHDSEDENENSYSYKSFVYMFVYLKDSKTKKNEKKADQGLTTIKRILKYTHN